ncbi:MAG: gluconeogenesis factor [Patescibacteria group bacterium]|nr:MAG: gluconeogenesis factor [Patescibacteria group bacterium]
MHKIKVVTMGGGTGTFPVVTALKKLDFDISAIVSVSDSGGSTGRIRDEFGFQPVGDLRQSLAALADLDSQEWIQKLLLYRFSKGNGLQGHNLGNLILTALQDMTGNTTQSLEIAEQIFNLDGSVIPVTASNVNLKIHYSDGTTAIGEHILDDESPEPKKIKKVSLVPNCVINPPAKEALLHADYIIIGPGDLYASLLATLAVDDGKEIFSQITGKIIYVLNLMTRLTQTHEMSAQQHVQKIEAALGKEVDYIVVNDQEIPQAVLETYAQSNEFPVVDDLKNDTRAVRAKLLYDQLIQKKEHDTSHRSLLRHDYSKLKNTFQEIMKKE